MKYIASSFLAIILSVAFTSVAKAETELSSFNVVNLAYQGRLTQGGIPGYASLEAGVDSGSITAEEVIHAAIASGYLSEATLQDSEFITAVEHQLQNLVDDN
ncbi:hypothetical protein [Leptolyngbya sp. FACHB-16]|uniref:hypothetical protein n=1 Tax=unclassified Leptolyngbya TaxID=2650499 RepID=UPI001681D81C|nr:hypothetical protein [Leptolyngbya sp. FACHB-16]MBD2158897.1 hypothetical protein [Leptolyngbya sp. FACHB-16]